MNEIQQYICLCAAMGDYVLNDGSAQDFLTGGASADAFTQGEDVIDFSNPGIKSFEVLKSFTYSNEGAIAVTAQGTIILQGFKGEQTTSCSKSQQTLTSYKKGSLLASGSPISIFAPSGAVHMKRDRLSP